MVFFCGLLLSIAIFPLINAEWWGKKYGYVSLALAIPAAILVLFQDWLLLYHVILEYISFIILLGSLFIISGGIVIKIGARGTPKLNLLLFFAGAVFASIIGTTGASMVLIRPLIRANKWRKQIVTYLHFFHFYSIQYRRAFNATGRSAALSGIFTGCSLLLDPQAYSFLALCGLHPAWFLCHR